VSSPGLRRYVKAREIPRIKNGLGMAILSTPQGLMTTAKRAPPGWAAKCSRCLVGDERCHGSAGSPCRCQGLTAQIDGHKITVKGPKGEISRTLHEDMLIALRDSTVVVKRPSEEAQHKSLHGLTRTLVANMVQGVTEGFAKSLEIQASATRPNRSRSRAARGGILASTYPRVPCRYPRSSRDSYRHRNLDSLWRVVGDGMRNPTTSCTPNGFGSAL